jgi:hypothetical protein
MKNEINYSPQKETTLSAIVRRQAETHADFTYSISGNVISIVDLDLGNRSVTNDIESVLRKIEHYHQGSIGGFRIMYRDYLPARLVLALYVPQSFLPPFYTYCTSILFVAFMIAWRP